MANDKTKDKTKTNSSGRDSKLHSGHRERLRDKMDNDKELKNFADHEFLELILSLVIPRRDTNELAHRLINEFGSLSSVFFVPPRRLYQIKGMTVGASYLLPLFVPLARRILSYSRADKRGENYETPKQLISFMHRYFIGRRTEVMILFLFDDAYRLIHTHTYDNSSPTGVTVTTEDVIKRALDEGATYATIAHNHPNGEVSPSDDDFNLTVTLNAAFKAANIKLLDHAIFYEEHVFSFFNSGLLDKINDDFAKDKEKKSARAYKKEREIFVTDLVEHYFNPELNADGVFVSEEGKDIVTSYLARAARKDLAKALHEARMKGKDTDAFKIEKELLLGYDSFIGGETHLLKYSFLAKDPDELDVSDTDEWLDEFERKEDIRAKRKQRKEKTEYPDDF